MILFFFFITVLIGGLWLWKFLQAKYSIHTSDAEKLTLRSLPLTLSFLVIVLYYFWVTEINEIHLLYIYPLTFMIGQFLFGYFLTPRINKKNDQHLILFIQLLLDKHNKEKLPELLIGYEFVNSKKLPQKLQYSKDEISHKFIVEEEGEFVSCHVQEIIKMNLSKIFPRDIDCISYKGQFRDEPIFTSVYYQNNNPIAIGITCLIDTLSFQGHIRGIHVMAKRSLISEFISSSMGSPKKIEDLLYWISNDNRSAFLGISPGPALTLFIFDHSKIIGDEGMLLEILINSTSILKG